MNNPSFVSRWNVDEIDRNYLRWLDSPSDLEPEWQYFFEGFHLGQDAGPPALAGEEPPSSLSQSASGIETHARLYGAIYAFRDIGHT